MSAEWVGDAPPKVSLLPAVAYGLAGLLGLVAIVFILVGALNMGGPRNQSAPAATHAAPAQIQFEVDSTAFDSNRNVTQRLAFGYEVCKVGGTIDEASLVVAAWPRAVDYPTAVKYVTTARQTICPGG